jgi:Domain of unknown function (DUF4263)
LKVAALGLRAWYTWLCGRGDALLAVFQKKASQKRGGPLRFEPLDPQIKKLDLTKFSKELEAYATELIEVLSQLDAGTLPRHLTLARTAIGSDIQWFNFHDASVYTLIAYGEPGLNALYELATLNDIRGYSAQRTLAAVASGQSQFLTLQASLTLFFVPGRAVDRLIEHIERVCGQQSLRNYAKRLLTQVVQSFLGDPLQRMRLGSLLTSTTLPVLPGEKPPAADVVLDCLARAVITISDPVLDKLEALIEQDLLEPEYQAFFEQHPALIDALASEIVPRQYLGGKWGSDFVVRRLDDQYVFVEIERPRDAPMTSYPHPTPRLSHALGQVLNWFSWVEDNIAYAHSNGFPGVHSPTGVIVIGRLRDMKPAQSRALKQLNCQLTPRLTILTYDDVLTQGRNVVRNLSTRRIAPHTTPSAQSRRKRRSRE